jgi:hypothetical protein
MIIAATISTGAVIRFCFWSTPFGPAISNNFFDGGVPRPEKLPLRQILKFVLGFSLKLQLWLRTLIWRFADETNQPPETVTFRLGCPTLTRPKTEEIVSSQPHLGISWLAVSSVVFKNVLTAFLELEMCPIAGWYFDNRAILIESFGLQSAFR